MIVEHNSYYGGKIQSLGFMSDRGEATVGVVEPGTFEMPTDCLEHITMLSGTGRVKVSDGEWQDFKTGDKLDLPANAVIAWEIAPPGACYLCVFEATGLAP